MLRKVERREKLGVNNLLELLTTSQGCNLEQKQFASRLIVFAQQKLSPPLRRLHFLTAGVALGDKTGFLAFTTVAKKEKKKKLFPEYFQLVCVGQQN